MASAQRLIGSKMQLHYHLIFSTSDERNKKNNPRGRTIFYIKSIRFNFKMLQW